MSALGRPLASTSKLARRPLHVSAVCRAAADPAQSSSASALSQEKTMAALARLQRTPYYLRPNASLADPVVFGQYYAMRDTSNMSFWQKFASRLTDFFLSRAASGQVAPSHSWPSFLSFLSVFSSKASQSLRQAAATSYISLHRAFESNTLWNAEIKAVASDALVRDLQRQRHELKNWDITWACTQDPDQLLGRHIWHNPNLKILGFRSGMAPTTDGFDQITQALVRFETTQTVAARYQPPGHPAIKSSSSDITEYYVFQRSLKNDTEPWKMVKRVFPQEQGITAQEIASIPSS